MTPGRPDPDALLRRLQAEDDRDHAGTDRRGRLKVFLGMSAGVGKTFEMLREALDLAAAGTDVVAGYVEPHGRGETERMLDGLEALPHREVAYAGTTVREFDLDAALARRPAVCLVDELAHTNAEGSRHAKRWQDVEELLDAVVRQSGSIEVLVTAAGAVGLAAAVAFPFSAVLGLADVAMWMLLAVLGVALRLGRGPSALAAVAAALATNFLFIPPLFTFLVQPGYLLTFVGMLAVALVVAALAARTRDVADAARERERRTDALYRLARDLVAVQRTPEVLKRTVARVGETFGLHVVALLPGESGRLESVIAHGGPARLPAREEGVAGWAFDHGRAAGRRTDTLAAADGLYLPFVAGGQPLGVLALFPGPDRVLAADEMALVEAFVNQAALALRRSDLAGWIWPAPAAPRPPLPSTAAALADA